jgi:hypothetical protein
VTPVKSCYFISPLLSHLLLSSPFFALLVDIKTSLERSHSTNTQLLQHKVSVSPLPQRKKSKAITMRTTVVLASILATALAAPTTLISPLRTREYSSPWQVAPDTKSACDHDTDKVLGLYVGPQVEEVVEDACVAMMPACAYADRLSEGTMCTQVVDWQLDGPKTSTQPANVEMIGGDKAPGWDVKCKLSAGGAIQVPFANPLTQFL